MTGALAEVHSAVMCGAIHGSVGAIRGSAFALLVAACCAGPALNARATLYSITTGLGQGADTFVVASAGNTPPYGPQGSAVNITLKNGTTVDATSRKGYLRFDLSAINLEIVTNVTLSLTVSMNNGGGTPVGPPQNFTVQVFGLTNGFAGVDGKWGTPDGDLLDDVDIHDEFWPESVIDWDSAPASVTNHGQNFTSDAVLLGSFPVTSSQTIGARVTMLSTVAFVNFLNYDDNGVVTLMLRRSGGTAAGSPNLSFYSKEFSIGVATDDPELMIQTIPEPATATLVGLAAVILLGCRRRDA